MQQIQVKYTPEQEQELVQLYQGGMDVKTISERLEKSERSVIAKLARLGVYRSTKPQAERRTKTDLVEEIATMLDLDLDKTLSLCKAEKVALELLVGAVRARTNRSE